jgi:antibiotic biosynthesis monooxygenase (ABM) superfamily enzyme
MTSTNTAQITAHVIKLLVKKEDHLPYTDWMVRVMMASVDYPNFLSAEMSPPMLPEQPEWKLVQLFRTPEHKMAWLKSDKYKKLLDEIKPLTNGESVTFVEHELEKASIRGTAATAVVTEVKPGMEEHYRTWEGKIQALQTKSHGYRGTFIQPPTKHNPDHWTTLVRFDTAEDLEHWFASDERKKLLDECNKFVNKVDFQRITNSFPGWFPTDKAGKGPANWKTALLVLLGLYPIVMLEIKYLNPLLVGFGSAAGGFIGNVLSVAFTTWVTVPLFIKIFHSWLLPEGKDAARTNLIGTIIIFALCAVEIAMFWHFL